MSLTTSLTRLLGIRTPIVLAPMGGASGGLLASQVSLAGGFGFMVPVPGHTITQWKEQLTIARNAFSTTTATQKSIPSPQILPTLPIGAGFLGWSMDAQLASASQSQQSNQGNKPSNPFLQAALDSRVRAIWLSFGSDLKKWIDVVRAHDEAATGKHGQGGNRTLIFVQVNSVEEAVVAVKEWGVDVVSLQGIEAGGHGSATAPPLQSLLTSTLSALSTLPSPSSSTPLLAAGGLTHGSQIASLLALGASGAVLGTRFLASPASLYSPAKKRAILAATESESERSFGFDWLQGRVGWPKGVDGRGLKIPAVDELKKFEAEEDSLEGGKKEEIRKKFQEAEKRGDEECLVVWAGTGVGKVNEVVEAKDIVEELHRDIVVSLRASGSPIVSDA